MNLAVPCSACGGATRRDGAVPDGRLVRCQTCGSRRIAQLVAREAVAAYGDAYRGGADPRKVAQLVALFMSSVPQGASGTLLDVGCGDGAFLEAVRASGWSVIGLDIDPGAVAAARSRQVDAVVAAAGKALDRSFDAVTLWDLLEHVKAPRETAAWLADRVAPGGHVIVLTPDATSVFDRVGAWERRCSLGRSQRIDQLCLNRYHLHRFTADGLTRLFSSVGFHTALLRPIQLFSLRPERYLSGFAPGIAGFTGRARLDAWLSRCAFAAVTRLRLHNKLLYVGVRRGRQ